MNKRKQQFFFEGDVPHDVSDVKIGFRVRKKLYQGKSLYQSIHVFDLYFYGKTLFLDRVLQTTEKDEFVYHEMLCQSPLFLHPNPKKVLIIGGGDGGSLEEVLKHTSVKQAVMVEIDRKVVEVSKHYLPSISKNAFKDKRTTLLFEDGKEFVKNHCNEFDIIILDLSDPGGPAQDLISPSFYRDCKRALKKNGIVSVQSGSFTTQAKLVALLQKRLQKVFSHVQIRWAVVPSYQAGVYTFTMASDFNFPKVSQSTLINKFKKAKRMNLKYWSPEMHTAAAVLPKYLQSILS